MISRRMLTSAAFLLVSRPASPRKAFSYLISRTDTPNPRKPPKWSVGPLLILYLLNVSSGRSTDT